MNKPVERAFSPGPKSAAEPSRPRISNRLVGEPLGPLHLPFGTAAEPPPPTSRHDGWTPERQRIFLRALAQCGVVADAARAAGMSKQSAYAFRSRAAGRGFHLGWTAALQIARHRLHDELISRALNGCVEVIVRNGEVWGERHRFDNRFALALLTRLDAQARAGNQEDRTAQYVAEEFDEFLDRLGIGRPGAIADFVESRSEADLYHSCEEARLCRRLDRFEAQGEGLDAEAEQRADEPDADHGDEDEGFDPLEGDEPQSEAPWQPSTSSTSSISPATSAPDELASDTPVIPAPAGVQPDSPPAPAPGPTARNHSVRAGPVEPSFMELNHSVRAEPVEAQSFSSCSTPPAAPPPPPRRRPLPQAEPLSPLNRRHFLDILDDPNSDPVVRHRFMAGPRGSGWGG